MAFVCSNPDCSLSETGKCVDGFEVGQCPHVTQDEVSSKTKTDEGFIAPEEKSSIVTIADAEILSIDKATDVLRAKKSCVITVIGPSDAGKTTFALCLYEALQHGPFHAWSFAGSLTLHAFEKRSHYSRILCGKPKPDTLRTPLSDGLGFLHLEIKDQHADYLDILISDRSGEYYGNVANGIEGVDDIHEVSRADYLLFFIDGLRLGTDERHGVTSDIKILIRSLIESNVLRSNQRIGLVLTKYDQVNVSPYKERIESDFDKLASQILDTYGNKFPNIKTYKIAARPDEEVFQEPYGVVNLLEECFMANPVIDYEAGPVSFPDRAFLRLHLPDGGTR